MSVTFLPQFPLEDKEKDIEEALRVLKLGGRFAVFGVVFLGKEDRLPAGVARGGETWTGCVSGALERHEHETLLAAAGFEDVSVEFAHVYQPEQVAGSPSSAHSCGPANP